MTLHRTTIYITINRCFQYSNSKMCNIDVMYDREQHIGVITISWCGLCLTCYPSPHIRRSMWHVSDRFQPSSTSDERNHVKLHPILPHQKAPKLRFVSSVEFRNSSGKSLNPCLAIHDILIIVSFSRPYFLLPTWYGI